jgi:hypothetical protein
MSNNHDNFTVKSHDFQDHLLGSSWQDHKLTQILNEANQQTATNLDTDRMQSIDSNPSPEDHHEAA